MIGSTSPRMLGIALPHVEAWNTWFDWYGNTADGFAARTTEIDEACRRAGRGPEEVRRSACVLVVLGPGPPERPVEEGVVPLAGPPERIARGLREFAAAGADEVILVVDPPSARLRLWCDGSPLELEWEQMTEVLANIVHHLPAQIRPTVERKVRKLERRGAALETWCVWGIGDEIRRLIVRNRERVARALSERRIVQLLVERHANRTVVAVEERVEVGPAERRLTRRARVLQFTARDHANDRRTVDGCAAVRGQRRILESIVGDLVVSRESQSPQRVIEPAGRARQ